MFKDKVRVGRLVLKPLSENDDSETRMAVSAVTPPSHVLSRCSFQVFP